MWVPFIPYVQGRNDYTDGDNVKYGLAFHNTSNDASDTEEADWATRRPDGTSAHVYVDGDSATQSVDTDDKTGHAGSAQGNENAISFELTGANGWTRAQWLANIEWNLLGRVAAAIIRHHWPDGSFQVRRASVAEMRANPKIKAMYGHDDMRLAWGGTTHTDPGPGFPWDHLAAVIDTALNQPTGEDDMIGFAIDDSGNLRKSVGGFTFPCTQKEMEDIRSLSAQGVLGPVSAKVHGNDATGTAFGYPVERLIDDIAKRVIELLPPGSGGTFPTAQQIADAVADEQADRMQG